MGFKDYSSGVHGTEDAASVGLQQDGATMGAGSTAAVCLTNLRGSHVQQLTSFGRYENRSIDIITSFFVNTKAVTEDRDSADFRSICNDYARNKIFSIYCKQEGRSVAKSSKNCESNE